MIGEYEPNDDECDWPSDEEDEELADDMKDKAKLEDEKTKKEAEEKDVKGVPEFWLTIFKNVDMLQEMVQEGDEPVLKKLQDITVTFSEKPMVSFKKVTLFEKDIPKSIFFFSGIHFALLLRAQRLLHQLRLDEGIRDEV